MKLRDRLWCFWHSVCPKHLIFIVYGGCFSCIQEKALNEEARIERLRKEQKEKA
jgi:hypothetical protein